MICSNCNTKNNSDSLYCYNCGCSLNSTVIKKNNYINNNDKESNNANVSLICGIICLVMAFIFNILCFIPGIISIVYAVKYKKESGKLGVGFGLSLGGMIYSFFIFILCLLFFIMLTNYTGNTDDYDNYYETQYTNNLYEV